MTLSKRTTSGAHAVATESATAPEKKKIAVVRQHNQFSGESEEGAKR